MDEVTMARPGEHRKILPCELRYGVSWNGLLRAGQAKLKLGLRDPKDPSYLLGTCESRSAGLAKRLWYYKNLVRSQVDPESLRPVYFESTEREKKEKTITKVHFADGEVRSSETVSKGKRTKTKDRVFAYDHAHDLLSSVLYLRSLPLEKGDEVNLVVHPFKTAYFAKFRVLRRETFKSGVGKVKAIKLNVKLYKIDRHNLELKGYDKVEKATLWISDDAYRMPLELRSEVFVGSIRVTLDSRKPLKP